MTPDILIIYQEQKNEEILEFFFVLEKKIIMAKKSFRDFRKVLMSSTNQLFPQDFTRLGNFLRLFLAIFWNGTWRRHLGQLTASSSLCILRLVFSLGQRRGAF